MPHKECLCGVFSHFLDAKNSLIDKALLLITDNEQLRALHQNILTLALPDSARLIAEEVMKLAK